MYVLGICLGHDCSAALVKDGKIIADVQEERYRRIKHFAGLPVNAIQYCLDVANISINDLDYIASSSMFPNQNLNHLFDLTGKERVPADTSIKTRIRDILVHRQDQKKPIYLKKFKKDPKTEIVFVEHHLAHAASAYFTLPSDEKQLIVTIDGSGDGFSTCIWKGENNKITSLKKWGNEASIGWFYSNVTEGIGWIHGDGEGKTMGLDPYGDAEQVQGVLDAYYPKFRNGELVEPYEFGKAFVYNDNGANQYHFEDAVPISKLVAKHGRENIAALAQRIIEEQIFEITFPWMQKENTENVCCAGGLFLNVKLNQRIWESGKVKSQHIYPNPGDAGLAAGAALQVYFDKNPSAEKHPIYDLYKGNEYSNDEIKEILDLRGLKYEYIDEIESHTANLLAEGKIIGWFQGRMEAGPRALGNRSIVMSSNDPKAKEVINSRVKFREGFRPFCPSILSEKAEDYLENFREELFMITSFTCKEEKRAKVPAVVHADHTMRPQTVRKDVNPRYWKLIKEFGDMTGEYLLLNTSFNVMGEPIVLHPRDAIRCFFDNGLDYLVLNNYLIGKQ